ncbi:hypothetical protein TVAG_287900 [Trichomonas vaginalis G3]|uniref:Intimal thickness related receptor IRP domain-containing protein n=1 Tax=Trichomonas vaginalis (strain ATCC PRA-98 / G3) TaxID=412133 RepID=A2ER57_TRIV3|nr:hypothetical protein TVAGG3_0183520 [Trichomonas vaginalis G3]EAY04876.1 hypothetical protein TVAG_287900 [Trichomonas vaginalis G3]KAI5549466.1 hypothetical protein TVAGG3_0183520 [Trichomonas vaginalis G3]|eukprot:XP_001317099.1 hypothetical protein [Trichomonas vaginalis G3]
MPTGYVVQRWIDVEGGVLEQNFSFLQCKGTCHLELFIFPEKTRKNVFPDNPDHQPICCDSNMKNCNPDYIVFNNKSDVVYRLFQIDGEPIEEKSKSNKNPIPQDPENKQFNIKPASLRGQQMLSQKYPGALSLSENRELYSIILANCGDRPFGLNGYIKVHSEKGYVDLRLSSFKYIITILTLFGISFTIGWFMFITKRRPKLTTQHYMFIGSAGFAAGYFFFESIMFWLWTYLDHAATLCIILAAVCRSASFAGLLYCTILGLQYPLEIQIHPFAAVLLTLSPSSFVDITGITTINSRQNGRWFLGFGAVPFLDFLILSISSVAIAIIAIKKAPEETNEDSRRKNFLVSFVASFASYILVSIAIVVLTIGLTTVEARFVDTVALLISPTYLICLLSMNGYFWFKFNPSGWVNANDGNFQDSENDIGILDQDPTEYVGTAIPSAIPEVAVKKSSKKKLSDDDFDIDDSFSGSSHDVEIEKID